MAQKCVFCGNKPQKKKIKELVFNENACNDMNSHCELSDFPNLELLTVKKGSFISLNSLRIVDNPSLKKIIIEDGTDASNGPFYKLNSLTISSNCNFKLFYSFFINGIFRSIMGIKSLSLLR